MSSAIEAVSWCHALTLAERVDLLRQAPERRPLDPAAQDRSDRRAARWRDELGPDHLTDRLRLEDPTEVEWRHVLGEPVEDLKARVAAPPDWLRELLAAYEAASADAPAIAAADAASAEGASEVLVAVAPPMRRARERLRAGLEDLRRAHPDAPFDPETLVRLLAPAVQHTLLYMVDRTLVLELHAARHRGELQGETAEARFASFVERLRRPEVALAILEEYPVLARQIVRLLDQWVAFGLEVATHLCADWSDLRATFAGGAHPGEIVALELAGDRHRGGRTVVIAGFAGGLRLVYKPKPLAVDVHFQELLSWLDERGADPPLRTLTVLDRGSYGWLEFVPASGCTSEEEVRRFYRRQGSLTMLLYALAATDFHFENLIAAGEHPVLIDLETLLHPLIGPEEPTGAQERAEQLLSRSVLRSGMIPEWMWGDGASRGIEISGLGAQKGQQTPFGRPTWEGAGTDDMHLVRKPSVVPEGRNRPTLNGADVDLLRYSAEILRGFTATYRLLMTHREALLAPDGPIHRFADDEVRVILRPSQRYGVLLYGGYHPNLLRSGLDRDRHFDRLWMGVDPQPLLRRVIAAERADLHDGDFPMFVTRPGARDLWSSRGVRYADAYPRSGLELVERNVRSLDEGDLERQLGLIRNALATLVSSPEGRGEARAAAVAMVPAAEEAGRDRLLAVARAVGDRLETLAVQSAGEATWIGLMSQGQALASRPIDVGLYGGRSGIALFLGHLGAVTGDEKYTGLARAALRSALREVDARPDSVSTIGAHDGWGALIYALSHLGALWDDPALLERAERAVEEVAPRIDRDDRLDIVGGAAGCIGSLLALHARAPSARTLAVAAACGERLLATAVPQARGAAWPAPVEVQAPLTGFSHGAAGMAWALARLATATGDERLRELAAAALAYERSAFVPEVGNWPDWRKDDTHPDGGEAVFVHGWCHGAPGIGLSRLGLLGHLDDPEIRAEIDVALRTTLAEGFGDTHSLCHGDLGNLDLLLVGADVLGRPEWREEARRLAASVLVDVERRGWRCGTPLRVEAPGLMVGLAGMGYGLLRLAEPERVPSVLLLAPPAAR